VQMRQFFILSFVYDLLFVTRRETLVNYTDFFLLQKKMLCDEAEDDEMPYIIMSFCRVSSPHLPKNETEKWKWRKSH